MTDSSRCTRIDSVLPLRGLCALRIMTKPKPEKLRLAVTRQTGASFFCHSAKGLA